MFSLLHPSSFDPRPIAINWGAADPIQRGPIIATLTKQTHRNVIGTLMRRDETSTRKFRTLLKEISLLAYEVTQDLPLKYEQIKTPLATMNAPVLATDKKLVLVSVMRAGQGILDEMLELIPSAQVGHTGLYRDPKTLIPVEYYFKVPQDVDKRDMFVVDPMLATGNSAVAAVERLKSTKSLIN